ncbi:hypothetical protein LCGC14_1089370 [marine sediment metagenome]|uniref:Uncharacterized protein n=1 Tax=marine sediment metagenome TaxID=412755 RepID=A0A0F9MHA7_9ZZZZ
MPNTGDWKAFERRVAAYLNTRRTPLSGAMSGHNTHSDTLHPDLYVECKWQGTKSAVLTLWDDTVAKAKREGKIPLLAMHRRGSRVEFGALPLPLAADLLKLFMALAPEKTSATTSMRCCKCNDPMSHAPHPMRGQGKDRMRVVRCGGHAFDRT